MSLYPRFNPSTSNSLLAKSDIYLAGLTSIVLFAAMASLYRYIFMPSTTNKSNSSRASGSFSLTNISGLGLQQLLIISVYMVMVFLPIPLRYSFASSLIWIFTIPPPSLLNIPNRLLNKP